MGPAGTVTFQRCTNKSMGDILKKKQQEEDDDDDDDDDEEEDDDDEEEEPSKMVFGAPDELGATKRQICGAAIAGGVAGALLGPVGAVTLAAGAAFAAAKRECEIGEAARTVGDAVCNSSAKILTEERVDRTVEGSCRRANLVNQSLTRTAQQCTLRASQGANEMHNKLSRTKEKCAQRAILIKGKVGQMKEQVGQVKGRVSTKLARRKNKQNDEEGDETEFFDCQDDWEQIEDAMEDEETKVETKS